MSAIGAPKAQRSISPSMGRIRALAEDDVPQVADLYERVFGGGGGSASPALRSYLEEIFCRHPWRDETLPSLVYEDGDGRIIGCLGVMPRPMSMNRRPVRAAVSHHFMVEPGRRSPLVALDLLKAHFAGPQDISLADVNEPSRQVWAAVGGTTPLLYRIRWTRPLRPGRYALAVLGKRGLPKLLQVGLGPLGRVVDALAAPLPQSPFRPRPPAASGEELDGAALACCVAEFARSRSLRPEYDDRSAKWLLEILGQKSQLGMLRKVLVRSAEGRVAGWYLYYLRPGAVSEVVQIGARPESATDVLDHLFHDAWQGGAVALSGQVDPELMPALSDRDCLFRIDPTSVGVRLHSKHPDLIQAVLRGDAFLTRLEAEWWIPFGA